MDVDLDRDGRLRVAGVGPVEDRPQVGGAGQPEQPGAVLEGRGELGRGHPDVLLEPQDEARIDAARAGRHDQALERGEAHRRVDRSPPGHRRERGAGPQVAGHDPEILHRPAEELGRPARCVGVGQPVEAVAAEPPAETPLSRQGVGRRRRRQVGVEGGVEAGDGRDVGQDRRDGVQSGQRLRLVERSEIDQLAETGDHLTIHPDRFAEAGPAVDDPVTDRVDPTEPLDRLHHRRLIGPFAGHRQVRRAHDPILAVEDPELQAARPGVDDEDPHRRAPGRRVSGVRPGPPRMSSPLSPATPSRGCPGRPRLLAGCGPDAPAGHRPSTAGDGPPGRPVPAPGR